MQAGQQGGSGYRIADSACVVSFTLFAQSGISFWERTVHEFQQAGTTPGGTSQPSQDRPPVPHS